MPLKPEASLTVGLATGVLVYSIYQGAMPNVAEVRASAMEDDVIQGSERMATWTAAGTVAAVSLIAKDMTVFIIGGAAVVALAWWYRHADQVNPDTGKAAPRPARVDADMLTDDYPQTVQPAA